MGSITVELFSPVAGDQLYDNPGVPETMIWNGIPAHTEVSAVSIFAVGVSSIFMEILSEMPQPDSI